MAANSTSLEQLRSAGGVWVPLAKRLIEYVFRDHPTKRFTVRLWEGTEVGWGARSDFTLAFRDAATFWSLATSCDAAAFAESYVEGRLEIEGDVRAAVELASHLRSRASRLAPPLVWRLLRRPRRARELHMPSDDSRDVRAHYDLCDDFFRTFLDANMVYSCAYFAHPDQTLEEAQERKLELVCRKLQLRPGESFLDVGCGWGALVVFAARRFGVRAQGITLSRNQVQAARAKAAQAGLADRVTVDECHYAKLPEGAFDKIASVGMVEHVGIANYDWYFSSLHRALRPGGLLLNHGITQPPGRALNTGGDFMMKRVFPGAEIDDLPHTLAVMERQGFEIVDVQSLRRHYALTLDAWSRRYTARRSEAARLVSGQTLRAWDIYLPGCRQAFAEGVVSVHQCLAAKPDEHGRTGAPLTREEMMLRL